MAKLEDLMQELQNGTKASRSNNSQVSKIKAVGRKRRVWLEECDNSKTSSAQESEVEKIQSHDKHDSSTPFINTIHKPLKSKGSMKGVYRPDSSTPFINTIHRPLKSKGSMKGVYRPDSLHLADLRSNPLQLIRFFFALSEEENNEHQTGRVRLREVMQHLDISKDSARTALRFLLKQGLIKRVAFKAGQLGWSKYQLKKAICKELEIGVSKGSIDPFEVTVNVKPSKGSNSSSSYIYNNNTTTTTTTTTVDPFELENIDTTALEFVGFTKKHLLQLKTKIDPSLIQESINHFAYAVRHNPKVKKYDSPIAAFMSVLKRGEPWIEPNYQSPQEIAQRQLIEGKKAERARLKQLEEDAYKLALDEWQETLTAEQLEAIAPLKKGGRDLMPQHVKLSMYFRKNVWNEKKKDYLIN